MSIHRLKTSKPETEKREDDEKVRSTVESILADIEKRGDVSVRELSKKFDAYEPANNVNSNFKLGLKRDPAAKYRKYEPGPWAAC